MVTTVGIDIGSQKTILVADDGEIVRTDTGSISVPTLVSFVNSSRYVGDEAASFPVGGGTVALINLAVSPAAGRYISERGSHKSFLEYCSAVFDVDEASGEAVYRDIPYCGSALALPAPAVLAVLIGQHARRVEEVYGPGVRLAFVLPHGFQIALASNFIKACEIAGVSRARVDLIDSAEALTATYCRKISALRPADREALRGKAVLFVEVGHTQSTLIVVRVLSKENEKAEEKVEPLAIEYCDSLGTMSFDICLFKHFASIVEKKHGEQVVPGTKRGLRLMSGCERIRKLLSQLNEAQITVENLTDSGDVNFSLRRDELSAVCASSLEEFRQLAQSALASARAASGDGDFSVFAVEILGGGMRMQILQQALSEIVGQTVPMGAKFDDGSAALGAAIVSKGRAATEARPPLVAGEGTPVSEGESTYAAAPEGPAEPTSFFSKYDISAVANDTFEAEVALARAREAEMQERDAEVRRLLAERNAMEAYMYEVKSAVSRKHGNLIDSAVLNRKMEDYENWLWENPPESTPFEILQNQFAVVKAEMSEVMEAYNTAVNNEKLILEQQLEEESKRAAAEREAEGEDEDHDNRKLKKADRMRLVVKNKEEGNELFKGGNVRPAAARYHKALTHASKFFDLSPDDASEIDQTKVSLYLNLTQCYIKLESWDQALRNVEEALKLDPNNAKAYFRRSVVWETKKEYDRALEDLKKAESLTPQDAMIAKACDRITKLIAKEKAKEKRMWGKAFGGGSNETAASAPPSQL